jgi:hypothetical protein
MSTSLAYSYDGIEWYKSPSSVFSTGQNSWFVWNGLIWVAAAIAVTSTSTLAYSYDGINWTASASGTAILNNNVYQVAWNGSVFVAVGQGTSASLAYSYDGINWTASSSAYAILNSVIYGVSWNGSIFLAGYLTKLIYSTDGITWLTLLDPSPSVSSKLASNGQIILLGSAGNGTSLYSSSNGTTWTVRAAALLTQGVLAYPAGVNCIVWNGSIWVVGSYSANRIIYSTDGINWTASSSANTLFSNSVASIVWNGSIFIAGGDYLNYVVAISRDGINWTNNTIITSVLPSANSAPYIFGNRSIPPIVGTNAYINTAAISYMPATSGNWVAPIPRTLTAAIDRIAAAVSTLRTSAIP